MWGHSHIVSLSDIGIADYSNLVGWLQPFDRGFRKQPQ
jgi:hypothetical protein